MKHPYFTKEELQDLGFKYQGLTKEDEFQYDWWSLELCGIYIDVTFEYDLNSKDPKTSFIEINNYSMIAEFTKNEALQIIEILKKIRE